MSTILQAADASHWVYWPTVRPLYRNLSFCLEQQTLNLIVGASGSGKSTLLRQLLGLERCCWGDLGLEVRPHEPAQQRRGVQSAPADLAASLANFASLPMPVLQTWYRRYGFLIPKRPLWVQELSTRDHLRLASRSSASTFTPHWRRRGKDSLQPLLQRFRLDTVQTAKPDTLPLFVQKRIALAMCWLRKPAIVGLDEPCFGLGETEAMSLVPQIDLLWQRETRFVLATWHPQSLKLLEAVDCHRIVLGSPSRCAEQE